MATFKFIRGKYTDDYIFENRDTALFAMTNDEATEDIPLDSINNKDFQEAIVGRSNSNRICDVATISPNQISNIELKYNTRNSTIEMGDSNKMTFMSPSNNVLKSMFITKAKEKISNATKSGNVTVNLPDNNVKSTVTFGLNDKTFSKDFIFNVSGKIKESVYTKIIDGPQKVIYNIEQKGETGDFYFVNYEKLVKYDPEKYISTKLNELNIDDNNIKTGLFSGYNIINSDNVRKLSLKLENTTGDGSLPDTLVDSVRYIDNNTLYLYEVSYETPSSTYTGIPTINNNIIKSKLGGATRIPSTIEINEKEYPIEFTHSDNSNEFESDDNNYEYYNYRYTESGTYLKEYYDEYDEMLKSEDATLSELITDGVITFKDYNKPDYKFSVNINNNSFRFTFEYGKEKSDDFKSFEYSPEGGIISVNYKPYDDISNTFAIEINYGKSNYILTLLGSKKMSLSDNDIKNIVYANIDYDKKPNNLSYIDSGTDNLVNTNDYNDTNKTYYLLSANHKIYNDSKFYESIGDTSPYYSLEVHENVPIDNNNIEITDNVPTPKPVTNDNSFIIRKISEFEIIGNMND